MASEIRNMEEFLEGVRTRAYEPLLHSTFHRLLGRQDYLYPLREEYVQDVYLKVWEHFALHPQEPFRQQLSTIAAQEAAKILPPSRTQQIEDAAVSEEPAIIKNSFSSIVYKGLRKLPENLRAPLLLFINGYRTNEIASILDIPPSYASTRKRRALQRMKEYLLQQGDESSPFPIGTIAQTYRDELRRRTLQRAVLAFSVPPARATSFSTARSSEGFLDDEPEEFLLDDDDEVSAASIARPMYGLDSFFHHCGSAKITGKACRPPGFPMRK